MDINDIAQAAGVSRATVSRYLNDGYVSKDKREVIARVIRETGYVPSSHAQTLRTGKTKLVGVIIPKINSHSVSRMVAGISSVLSEAGYQVLLTNTDGDNALELEYLSLFAERNKVDGVILIATSITSSHRKKIDALDVPVLIMGQKEEGYSCVYNDDYHAIYEVSELCLSNAKEAAYIGVNEEDLAAGQLRKQAFIDACEKAGIELDDACFEVSTFSADGGYECCERLLESKHSFDTIICATDEIAYGVITCLREYGKRVPEDVQVSGLGDGLMAAISYPSLTSVHYFYRTSGEEAARMLITSMEKGSKLARQLMMGYEVRKRESSRA